MLDRREGDQPAAAPVPDRDGAGLAQESRGLPIWAYVGIVAVYLVIVQGAGQLLTADLDIKYAAPTSVNELWRSITVPVWASLVFVYAVVGDWAGGDPCSPTTSQSSAGCAPSRSSWSSPRWPG
jgi:hypothetical protein